MKIRFYRNLLGGDSIPPWVGWIILALLAHNIIRAVFFGHPF